MKLRVGDRLDIVREVDGAKLTGTVNAVSPSLSLPVNVTFDMKKGVRVPTSLHMSARGAWSDYRTTHANGVPIEDIPTRLYPGATVALKNLVVESDKHIRAVIEGSTSDLRYPWRLKATDGQHFDFRLDGRGLSEQKRWQVIEVDDEPFPSNR